MHTQVSTPVIHKSAVIPTSSLYLFSEGCTDHPLSQNQPLPFWPQDPPCESATVGTEQDGNDSHQCWFCQECLNLGFGEKPLQTD